MSNKRGVHSGCAAIIFQFVFIQTIASAQDSATLIKSAKQAEFTRDFARAGKLYTQALQQKLTEKEQVEVLARRAALLVRSGHPKDAQALDDRAVKLARKLKAEGNLTDELAFSLDWLSDSYGQLMNSEIKVLPDQGLATEQAAQNCVDIAELLSNKLVYAKALCTLGLAKTEASKWKEGEQVYGRAISIMKDLGPHSESYLSMGFRHALLLIKIGKKAEGERELEALKKESMKRRSESATLEQIAVAYNWIQDAEGSLKTHIQALSKIDKQSPLAQAEEANLLLEMGRVYAELRKDSDSERCYHRAIQLAEQAKNKDLELMGLKALWTQLKGEKKTAEAEKTLVLVRKLSGSLTEQNGKWLEEEEEQQVIKERRAHGKSAD
jgi:tetratricopeptide (TPR) repeat protein